MGDRSEQQARNAGTAVGAHDDQVSKQIDRELRDLFACSSRANVWNDRDPRSVGNQDTVVPQDLELASNQALEALERETAFFFAGTVSERVGVNLGINVNDVKLAAWSPLHEAKGVGKSQVAYSRIIHPYDHDERLITRSATHFQPRWQRSGLFDIAKARDARAVPVGDARASDNARGQAPSHGG